ncbi:CDAN1-interacting nuclease 1 isoform X1 [Microplitis demolitor]|uniref:CDAN1-interacting nuclease 1 isoform X1 n=2 Tax=Microplitis demolitor TaxID=69319 RepID=UPI0004CDD84A|nr:CDAN1-interacting nuclease 1 isoform X1 [Microplitis demolitor]
MKIELYKEIVNDIGKFKGLTRDCADMLIKKYPDVSSNAIHSILSAEVMQRMKTCRNKLHGIRYDHYGQYIKAKKSGQRPGIIVRLAAAANLPPALLARVILERHFSNDNKKFSRTFISQYMKDTTLIQDPDLAYEVYLCVLYDDRNGFISDSLCLAIGNEYELKLQQYLNECNAAYSTEDDLRERGYDKTPDVKLEIPLAVNGFIINWIESKGRFGSPDIHKTHVKEQFLSYWNRFGPGLVIYWFGFVDNIVEPSEEKFIIMDHFPENIVHMNPIIPEL